MTNVVINSMDQLIRLLNEFPNHYVFRGHANSRWKLESSLERVIGAGWSAQSAEKFESRSMDLFASKFHLYDCENIFPESKLATLALMQHYGVPTRLIDFTESPYVALFFALEAYDAQSDADFAVYALDYSAIMERSINYIRDRDAAFQETRQSVHKKQDEIFEQIVDRFAYEIVWVTEPKQLNARLDRQAGCFLLSGNKGTKIESILSSGIYADCDMQKLTISGSFYPSVFALLRKMNITSKSIYGDLVGLAKSIKMEMQVYSRP